MNNQDARTLLRVEMINQQEIHFYAYKAQLSQSKREPGFVNILLSALGFYPFT